MSQTRRECSSLYCSLYSLHSSVSFLFFRFRFSSTPIFFHLLTYLLTYLPIYLRHSFHTLFYLPNLGQEYGIYCAAQCNVVHRFCELPANAKHGVSSMPFLCFVRFSFSHRQQRCAGAGAGAVVILAPPLLYHFPSPSNSF